MLLASCATYAPKYAGGEPLVVRSSHGPVSHTFYLIGDAGLSPMDGMNPVLQRFRDRLTTAAPNSTALFLGDNIYPKGLPEEGAPGYALAESHLKAQLLTLEGFPGRPLFIPGNHDWYSEGLKGLKRQEKYVEDFLDRKNVFQPENGCPLRVETLSEDLVLIVVDTEWYLADWDRHPGINDDCDIKSREVFWNEVGSEIKKHAEKTILLAAHHPMFTYGEHGGQFTLKQQVFPASDKLPLPVLGSLGNLIRKTAGVSREDLFNKRYREMRERLITLARHGERVIIASGHEHTLQYIVEQEIPQIVSGAGAKKGATRLLGGSRFSSGQRGYVVLELFGDGASLVRYYGVTDNGEETLLYETEVYAPYEPANANPRHTAYPKDTLASVYTREEVDKGGLYRRLWGERYRAYYATPVKAPLVGLDTLYGGLVPVRKGGGQQSKSLRLRHGSGKEYVMRALRKQAEQNLQAAVFLDQYIKGQLGSTAPVAFLEDLYTGAHPYAPFALDVLMDSLEIYHTNPRLFYVPKQPALERFNADFGDELYMIEEHPSEGHERLASFGFARDIESTADMLERLRRDEKYSVDTEAYLRARLFDMLIGDWDRHQDQWRWAEFEEGDSVVYRPIPRDRDQVFSIMGDGWLGAFLTRAIPAVKKMEGFGPEVRNVRTFNTNPFPLDMALLGSSTREQWQRQAALICSRVSPELVARSFEGLPAEVRESTTAAVTGILMTRLDRLEETALRYYNTLQQYIVVQGTDKDDWFVLEGAASGGVRLTAYRNIGGEKQKPFFSKVFDPEQTREVWVYGLDDADRFEVDLPRGNRIRFRLIGGLGRDRYEVAAGKRVFLYDYKSKRSEVTGMGGARRRFTDSYDVNTYQPLKLGNFQSQLLPAFGFNPDDGFRTGLSWTHSRYGFRRNPFTTRHQFSGAYYFATSGFDLNYTGEFANALGNWNFQVAGRYTSPNFSMNFFGIGNETANPDDDLGLDYNRVRMRILEVKPALVWRGPMGGSFRAGAGYEYITVEETSDRFVNVFFQANGEERTQEFAGVFGEYRFENRDSEAFPTLGMSASLEAGFKKQLSGGAQDHFGYLVPELALDHPLIPSGALVLATRWKAHFNMGNGYAFYQAASIGASDGPRSFRNERFSGKTAYYQLTDLRYQFRQWKTGFLPMSLGVFGGFDYGRVWSPGLPSSLWHTSFGGGFFLNGLDLATARFSLFTGSEGLRFSFGVGFDF
ncbi:metallophosphoesterase [Robiginitalea sediminis]|uniref:metallophosphoesterase n=1 Tax=Robiginitalea sediminis TaxID=1982593 RepID=UPI001E2B4AE4|nr:metallophosphoesterase [Robiginitalea sediminis]